MFTNGGFTHSTSGYICPIQNAEDLIAMKTLRTTQLPNPVGII
jgi:hypothetical protein